MFCPRCGAGVPAGHAECNACGNLLPVRPEIPRAKPYAPGDARWPVNGLGEIGPRW
jgi:hypothetical protein